MASEIYEIAQSVVMTLQDAPFNVLVGAVPFSPLFFPTRVYLPLVELTALATDLRPTVLVVPSSYVNEVQTRDGTWEEINVDVGVMQRLAPNVDPTTSAANDVIDPLVKLCRQIALVFQPGDTAADATWWQTKYLAIYDVEKMREERLFFAVLRLAFKQPSN